MNDQSPLTIAPGAHAPFTNEDWTAKGERRALAPLIGMHALWFNTGTLCNIECANCYIKSSPINDRLTYIARAEAAEYLDQIEAHSWSTREIGFTGGEPFMNPDMIDMAEDALARGYAVLILTNAMAPMMRPQVRAGLTDLRRSFGDRLTLRVSLDHHTAALHDKERGADAFDKTLAGMRWLAAAGVRMTVAGRTMWGEAEGEAREGYAALFATEGFAIDAADSAACMLFPEMDETAHAPEVTTACWGILGKRPADVMCATSRMVIKRRGAARPVVVACTLLPYDPRFELGETLAEAKRPVKLNHRHCAKFCVLGGASCSG